MASRADERATDFDVGVVTGRCVSEEPAYMAWLCRVRDYESFIQGWREGLEQRRQRRY